MQAQNQLYHELLKQNYSNCGCDSMLHPVTSWLLLWQHIHFLFFCSLSSCCRKQKVPYPSNNDCASVALFFSLSVIAEDTAQVAAWFFFAVFDLIAYSDSLFFLDKLFCWMLANNPTG